MRFSIVNVHVEKYLDLHYDNEIVGELYLR